MPKSPEQLGASLPEEEAKKFIEEGDLLFKSGVDSFHSLKDAEANRQFLKVIDNYEKANAVDKLIQLGDNEFIHDKFPWISTKAYEKAGAKDRLIEQGNYYIEKREDIPTAVEVYLKANAKEGEIGAKEIEKIKNELVNRCKNISLSEGDRQKMKNMSKFLIDLGSIEASEYKTTLKKELLRQGKIAARKTVVGKHKPFPSGSYYGVTPDDYCRMAEEFGFSKEELEEIKKEFEIESKKIEKSIPFGVSDFE